VIWDGPDGRPPRRSESAGAPLILTLLLLVAALALVACSHRSRPTGPDLGPEVGPPRFALPPREPGPPRAEEAAQVEAAAKEARALVRSFVGGGVPTREAASVADMRGYRLYRRRLFGQARAWFRAAVEVDPRFELSLYNGARCAALLGDRDEARALLARLRALGTPLGKARAELALSDPDLHSLMDPKK
jgi:hypothetical protein